MTEGRKVTGYKEVLRLEGVGDMIGAFDTGNSCYSALKTDHMEINGDKVKFDILGKTIEKDIVEWKAISHGGIKSENRPVVKFDITFNDKTIKDVKVNLRETTSYERKHKMEGGKRILLASSVVNQFNLLVHPDHGKEYILSDKDKIGKVNDKKKKQ
ncbi:MAG: hypothetical protein EOM74_00860 [Methanomicrobia archaeon]|nr:hypothetical protein [Methanomicrobia archaeon]